MRPCTRVTPDSKTLIDLIAANNPHNISSSGVISYSLSDHEIVYCVRKINWKRAPGLIKTFRNYVKYDPKILCDELKDANLTPESTCNQNLCDQPVNYLWNVFNTTFISIAENHAPIIQKRVRVIDDYPWLDSSIKNAIKQRDHLHKKACKTTNAEDWANYRRLRNRVNNMVNLKGQRVLIIGDYWKKTRMIAKCFGKPLKRSYLLRAKKYPRVLELGVLIVTIKFPLRLHLINILLVPSSVLEMLSGPP